MRVLIPEFVFLSWEQSPTQNMLHPRTGVTERHATSVLAFQPIFRLTAYDPVKPIAPRVVYSTCGQARDRLGLGTGGGQRGLHVPAPPPCPRPRPCGIPARS